MLVLVNITTLRSELSVHTKLDHEHSISFAKHGIW